MRKLNRTNYIILSQLFEKKKFQNQTNLGFKKTYIEIYNFTWKQEATQIWKKRRKGKECIHKERSLASTRDAETQRKIRRRIQHCEVWVHAIAVTGFGTESVKTKKWRAISKSVKRWGYFWNFVKSFTRVRAQNDRVRPCPLRLNRSIVLFYRFSFGAPPASCTPYAFPFAIYEMDVIKIK
jgi:hypothetical protein